MNAQEKRAEEIRKQAVEQKNAAEQQRALADQQVSFSAAQQNNAENQRQRVQDTGDTLMDQAGQVAGEAGGQRTATSDYLNSLEDPMAKGQGGYTADETSTIGMSPEEQQRMVTSAGITAGTSAAAAKGAVERQAAAAGGNPLALATYRARLDRQSAGEQADAMTKARVDASNAAAGRNKAVADTRLAQQTQGLNYYTGQNTQANANTNAALERQNQVYGTQTGGTNQAVGLQNQAVGLGTDAVNAGTGSVNAGTGAVNAETGAANNALQASNKPGMFDKILGAASGVASGLLTKLEDGTAGYLADGGMEAVVGENGPEAILSAPHMVDGTQGGQPEYGPDSDEFAAPVDPNLSQLTSAGGGIGQTPKDSWWRRAGNSLKERRDQQSIQPVQPVPASPGAWSPVDTYSNVGKTAGQALGMFTSLADGMAGGPPQYRSGSIRSRGAGMGAAPVMGAAPTPVMGGTAGGVQQPQMAAQNAVPAAPAPAMQAPQQVIGTHITAPPRGWGARPVPTATLAAGGSRDDIGLQPQQAGMQPQQVIGTHITAPPRGWGARPVPTGKLADGGVTAAMPSSVTINNNSDDSNTDHPWWQDLVKGAGQSLMGSAFGALEDGMEGGASPSAPPQIVTSPTRVHLDKGDTVVPLSYRAKAKVRPSAALAAMAPQASSHHFYGARRG